MTDARKLHFKNIIADATTYTGRPGDVWFSEDGTELRTYDNGTPGGKTFGGGGLSTGNYIDYGTDYNGELTVAIDLTKKYHWLIDLNTNGHYTLADGVEGQELVFFPCSGYTGDNDTCQMYIENVYYWDVNINQYVGGGRAVVPFSADQSNTLCTKISAIYINGAWHFDAPMYDVSSLP